MIHHRNLQKFSDLDKIKGDVNVFFRGLALAAGMAFVFLAAVMDVVRALKGLVS